MQLAFEAEIAMQRGLQSPNNCTSIAECGHVDHDSAVVIDFKENSFFFLFILFILTIAVSLVKLCFFDIPRDKRDSKSRATRRQRLIESALIRKTVIKDGHLKEVPVKRTELKNDIVIADNGESTSESELMECAICWEEFKENEQICWSRNPQCNHAFHYECMHSWLMKNDLCPICRNNYLGPNGPEEENTQEVVAEVSRPRSAVTGSYSGYSFTSSSVVELIQSYYRMDSLSSNIEAVIPPENHESTTEGTAGLESSSPESAAGSNMDVETGLTGDKTEDHPSLLEDVDINLDRAPVGDEPLASPSGEEVESG